MAITYTVPNAFSPNSTIASAQVNANETYTKTIFDGIEAATTTFAKLKVDADPSTNLEVSTKQYVDNLVANFTGYRRPTLKWVSITQVDVEENTGTANQTRIVFPDGTSRSVTENTSVSTQYRRFDITAVANFTSGTEDSGLRSGITEASNTHYAIYAVKSQINAANFVLAGDTGWPGLGAFSTLNTRFGTNSWVYLGTIANGDNSAVPSDILRFTQCGAHTMFTNVLTATSTISGYVLTNGTTTSLSWTYVQGSGATTVPPTVSIGDINITTSGASGAKRLQVQSSAGTVQYLILPLSSTPTDALCYSFSLPLTEGLLTKLDNSASASFYIVCFGWEDIVLAAGSGALL